MLKLWDLAPSPNNTKVRMALRFKGIPFEATPVDPMDRSAVREVSGQDLTPVIEDKGIVLPDSEAILEYLDANYRDTPRLFPADREGRKACDAWKAKLDAEVAPPWAAVFFHVIGMKPELGDGDAEAVRASLRWLEEQIGEDGHVPGADEPICDLRVAEWATYALPGEGFVARVPLVAKFRDLVGAKPEDTPRLAELLKPWNERLA